MFVPSVVFQSAMSIPTLAESYFLSINGRKFTAWFLHSHLLHKVASFNWTQCLLILGHTVEINGLTHVFMRNQFWFKLVVVQEDCLHLLNTQYSCTGDNWEEKYYQMLQVLCAWSLPFYYFKSSLVKNSVKGTAVTLFTAFWERKQWSDCWYLWTFSRTRLKTRERSSLGLDKTSLNASCNAQRYLCVFSFKRCGTQWDGLTLCLELLVRSIFPPGLCLSCPYTWMKLC